MRRVGPGGAGGVRPSCRVSSNSPELAEGEAGHCRFVRTSHTAWRQPQRWRRSEPPLEDQEPVSCSVDMRSPWRRAGGPGGGVPGPQGRGSSPVHTAPEGACDRVLTSRTLPLRAREAGVRTAPVVLSPENTPSVGPGVSAPESAGPGQVGAGDRSAR